MSDADTLAAYGDYAAMLNRALRANHDAQHLVDAMVAQSTRAESGRTIIRRRCALLGPQCTCLDSCRAGCEFHDPDEGTRKANP